MIIRKATKSDLEQIKAIYNEFIIDTAVNFETQPYDDVYMQNWFLQFADNTRYQAFVASEGEQILGFIVSQKFKPKPAYQTSVETTIYLTKAARGQGLGSKLLRHLLLQLKTCDVKRAYASIALPNEASVKLHQKLGYQKIAHLSEVGRKFGNYYDVAMFEYKFSIS